MAVESTKDSFHRCLSLCQTPPSSFRGWNTVLGTCKHVFRFQIRKAKSAMRNVDQSLLRYRPLRRYTPRRELVKVSQCPSYHEFITAIHHELLCNVWRVPAMAIAFSGVPQGGMLYPLHFLFAPLWIEGASAYKLGSFTKCAFWISCRAAVHAVGSGRFRCIKSLGLGQP